MLLKLGASLLAIAGALAAPLISVPGSVLLVGLLLAGMVIYGVTMQHRLHLTSR